MSSINNHVNMELFCKFLPGYILIDINGMISISSVQNISEILGATVYIPVSLMDRVSRDANFLWNGRNPLFFCTKIFTSENGLNPRRSFLIVCRGPY